MMLARSDLPQGELRRLILIVVSGCLKEVWNGLVAPPMAPKEDGGAA
jgi:hypothetical protein